MKSKDISLVVVVGIVSAVIAVLVSSVLFSSKADRQQTVEVVEPITADFMTPSNDSKYFNNDAINPSQTITIGESTNEQPFN